MPLLSVPYPIKRQRGGSGEFALMTGAGLMSARPRSVHLSETVEGHVFPVDAAGRKDRQTSEDFHHKGLIGSRVRKEAEGHRGHRSLHK